MAPKGPDAGLRFTGLVAALFSEEISWQGQQRKWTTAARKVSAAATSGPAEIRAHHHVLIEDPRMLQTIKVEIDSSGRIHPVEPLNTYRLAVRS